MARQKVIIALFGLVMGAAGMLFWLSPRLQKDQLAAALPSATRPLTIPFSRLLTTTDPTPWVDISPTAQGHWQTAGPHLNFFPTVPLIYGQTYTVTVKAGLPGVNGLPLLRTTAWTFQVDSPTLLYLRAENDGRLNVWQQNLSGAALPRRLTDEPLTAWEYDAAAGWRSLLVVSEDEDGSLDLAGYDLDNGDRTIWLDCTAHCENARQQPWGKLVAYELRPQQGPSPQVWLLDPTSGETWSAQPSAAFADLGLPLTTGQFPRWSADGRYLAYFAAEAQVIVILDATDLDTPILLPATLDTLGQWSPVAPLLAYTEYARSISQPHTHTLADGTVINHTGAELYSHTIIANMVRQEAVDVVQGTEYNDGLATWLPTGELLAVPRSLAGEGAQIWLMAPDGTADEAITALPLVNHSSLVWCPCGRTLAYQRSPIDGSAPSSIWLYDRERGTHQLVQEKAFAPGWLP